MQLNMRTTDGRAAGQLPDPRFFTTATLLSLRPTQFAVGMREVSKKREKIERRAPAAIQRMPVILGPQRQFYLHDRHHYAVALSQMGVEQIEIEVIDDLSRLDPSTFWLTLALRSWTRQIDGTGRRRSFEHMPQNVLALEDDPFRSLAGELRRLGLYAKTAIAYADFAWAEFLRDRIDRRHVDHDFHAALDEAIGLVRASPQARHLPGWQMFTGIEHAYPTPVASPDPY